VATAPRFRTNSKVGDYEIQIVATYRDTVSKTVIPQTNLFKLKSSNKKFFILSTVIGGAAAAALVSRRGSSGPVSSALESLAVTPTLTVGGSSSGPIPLTLSHHFPNSVGRYGFNAGALQHSFNAGRDLRIDYDNVHRAADNRDTFCPIVVLGEVEIEELSLSNPIKRRLISRLELRSRIFRTDLHACLMA
jgi:hypothetical protein